MADESLVLCDVLCFITNKYYKTPAKLLKSCVADFYSVDALSEAKVRLLADISAMNSTAKFPHVSQHRDGDGRLLRELDDIMSLVVCLDEHKLMDMLPRYVASGPDNMPSMRLYEGDLKVILALIGKMDKKCSEMGSALAAISRDVRGLQARSRPPESSAHLLLPAVNKSAAVSLCQPGELSVPGISVNNPLTESEIATAMAAADTDDLVPLTEGTRDWASIASTPAVHISNQFAVLQSTEDDERSDNQGGQFFNVVNSRRRKRLRRRSPEQPTGVVQPTQPPTRQSRRAPPVFGRATTHAKVVAAKKIPKKAIYCIDNVSTDCSTDDIRSFVNRLGVTVLSCFEAKTRKLRSDQAGDADSRKAFRLCIDESDRDRLLDATMWPESVSIAEWYFKPASRVNDDRRRVVQSTDVEQATVASRAIRTSIDDASVSPVQPPLSADDTAAKIMDQSVSDTTLLYHDGATAAAATTVC